MLSTATALLLGSLTVPAVQDDPVREASATKGPHVLWEESGTDVKGDPEDLDHAEVALTTPKTDLCKGGKPLAAINAPLKKGENEASLAGLISGKDPGTYHVWVRAFDRQGNASDWAGPVALVVKTDGNAEAGPPIPSNKPEAAGTPRPPASTQSASPPAPPRAAKAKPWKTHRPNDVNVGCAIL